MDCSPLDSSVMGFSRQEYRSGLPLPPPGDLPDAGIKPEYLMSLALVGGFFTSIITWEAPQSESVSHSDCPWDSLGKNTGVGCHPLL